MQQIKSYEEACELLKLNPADERPYKGAKLTKKQKWFNAVSDMVIILDALHIGVKGARIWYPIFFKSGFGFSHSDTGYACTHTGVGARLKSATREISDYSGKTFTKLHKIIQLG